MTVIQRESENESDVKVAGRSSAEQGQTYEKLLFILLAKKGYELSKDGKFKDGEFSIGKELNLSLDVKFDDIVFSYKGLDDTKNLVFVQVKHKQDESQMINYKILSSEEWKARGSLHENFNLQKYFISFLRMREELKGTTSEELKDGEIKYVAIYTNIGLNVKNLDLKSNEDDDSLNHIKSIFSFEKSPIDCYQLNSLTDELRNILEKSSDLHRLARELAQCVVWENYREKNILGKEETAVSLYQVALEKEVIRKSSEKGYKENEQYCVAYFQEDFIDNEEPGPKKELRDALFQAVIELVKSETDTSEDGLKSILRKVEMKVTPNFGKTKQKNTTLQCEWMTVTERDINDFLKCFVFLVNQPNVTRLITLIHPDKDSILKGSHVGQVFDNILPKWRERIEKELGLYEKASRKEIWLSGEKIIQFVKEQEEAVTISILTLIYENNVMKYGEFINLGKIEAILDNFLNGKMGKEEELKERHLLLKESKILSVCSEITLLSAVKILQFLKIINYREKNNYIYIELDELIGMRDSVEKAFSSETYKLLVIECRYKVNKQCAEEICRSFSSIVESKRNKKIIIINKEGEHNILTERFVFYFKKLFQNECDPEKMYVQETDDIHLKDFVPVEDPFEKKVIVFRGQEKKVSLAELTAFQDWNTYVDYLYQGIIPNKPVISDLMFEILNAESIEVGNKPLGTSSLEGAYATLFEKINSTTLVQRLLGNKDYENTSENKTLEDDIFACPSIFEEINTDSVTKNLDNDANEIYIFDGIMGSNRKEKIEKLEKFLKLDSGQERIDNMVGDIGSDSKIQIIDDETDDDPFTDENFKKVCNDHPNKKVFWIHIKDKENAELQHFYNPEFYLQRHFKNVIIKKEVIEDIMRGRLSEIFILYPVNNEEELIQSLNFTDVNIIEQPLINFGNFKIKLCALEDGVEAIFQEFCKHNETVHCLKLEDDQLIWCQSNGSLNSLRKYIVREQSEKSLVKEDDLIREITKKKVVIIADDPGMGKTTTITKLYESNVGSESFIATHWIIRINIKYHLQAVKDIDNSVTIINIVDFLSKVDLKLNNNVARSLLILALRKNEYFQNPLLLVFDGFDEIVNTEDRNKMITLMKFLKNKTTSKLWITTRLHYEKTLEDELSTFAFEFTPTNDKVKTAYIKNYLKSRLYFILKSEDFAEFFPNNDQMNENERLQKYINAFFKKMELIFKENVFKFIGTPLQLYLMLEGSPRHFKIWIENGLRRNLDFDYLGNDILEIYESFIHRKYNIYFKTMGINETVAQEKDKYIFDQFCEDFAKSLILKSKPKNTLQKFKDAVLALGVIKSNGNNIDFIHTTFTDYFAAEVFIHWIKETQNVVSSTSKREYLLKEILKKPDFQLIRTFINLKLKNRAGNFILEETLKQYGKSIQNLLSDKQSPLIDEVGTVLHIAVKEGNTNVICFLLNGLKGLKIALKQFLFACDKEGKTALHLACRGSDYKIVSTLLDNAEIISEDTLEEYLNILDDNKWNALDEAVCKSENVRIVNELLRKAKNKLDLMMNEKKSKSSLILACEFGKQRTVKILVQKFKGDHKALKKLLLFNRDCDNVLFCAALKSRAIVNYLLLIAKSINDNNETLKKLLLPEEGDLPLKKAIQRGNIAAIESLINVAKDVDDDNYTLEKMIFNCINIEPDLLIGGRKQRNVMKSLTETVVSLGDEEFEKFIFHLINTDMIFLHAIFRNGDEKIFTDSFKMLELDKYQYIREKLIETYNSAPLTVKLRFDKKRLIEAIRKNQFEKVRDILDCAKNSKINPREKLRILLFSDSNEKLKYNTLHEACHFRRTNIVEKLISYVIEINDKGETLKELITSRNYRKKTPFQMLGKKDTYRVKQIIERLISKARKDSNNEIVNILQIIINKLHN